jgi:hypothetical protein
MFNLATRLTVVTLVTLANPSQFYVHAVDSSSTTVDSSVLHTLVTELQAIRSLAQDQSKQISQQQQEMRELKDLLLTPEQRRHLSTENDLQETPKGSGIQIKADNALVALGKNSDIVFQRVATNTSHISGMTQFDKIYLNSTDDVIIGKYTLTELLCNDAACSANCDQSRVVTALSDSRDSFNPVVYDGTALGSWLQSSDNGLDITLNVVDEFTTESVAGSQLLVVTMDSQAPDGYPTFKDDERDVVRSFVEAGGSLLVFFGHLGIDTLSSAFGSHELYVECVSDSSSQCASIVAENAPSDLVSGPYGDVPDEICWNSNCHEDQSLGEFSEVLFEGDGHVEGSIIPPGAITKGSGAVLMYSDFYNSYSDWVTDYYEELAKNSFAYLLDNSCAPETVPTPDVRSCERNLVVTSLGADRDSFNPVVYDGTEFGTWLQGGDNVNHLGVTLNTVDEFTESALEGSQLLIVTMDSQAPDGYPEFSSDEQDAVLAFVEGGGSLLVFFGHQGVDTLSSVFGAHELYVECVSSSSQCASVTDDMPDDIINGPYGNLPDDICWNSNCHEDQTLGEEGLTILQGDGHIEGSLIPAGALSDGSGPVIMYSDFYNSYSDWVTDSYEELTKNTVAYLLDNSCAY